MNDILKNIANLLPQIYARSRFQVDDFLAILQGIAGFASGIASRDPFTVIDSVIGLAGATYSFVYGKRQTMADFRAALQTFG